MMIKQWYVYTMKFYVAMKINQLFKPFPISGQPSPEASDSHLHVLLNVSYLSSVLYIFRKVCGKDFSHSESKEFQTLLDLEHLFSPNLDKLSS